jgi:hypothetical protein
MGAGSTLPKVRREGAFGEQARQLRLDGSLHDRAVRGF